MMMMDDDNDNNDGDDANDNDDAEDANADDDNVDDDVSPDRVKSLPRLLKKHNVYFGKFIISRKWKEHKMLTFDLLNRGVGGWDKD